MTDVVQPDAILGADGVPIVQYHNFLVDAVTASDNKVIPNRYRVRASSAAEALELVGEGSAEVVEQGDPVDIAFIGIGLEQ